MDRPAAMRSSYAIMDRAVARRPVNRPLVIAIGTLAVSVLGFGGWAYATWVLTPAISVNADHLTIATVHLADFQGYVPVTGTAQPTTIVDLDAASAGEIRDLRVRDGDRVTAGQVLIMLRNPSLSLQITSEQAELAQGLAQLAAVQLDQAQSRLQHQRDLLDASAQLALDGAKYNREQPLVIGGVLARAPQSDLAVSVGHDQAVVDTLRQEVAADRASSKTQDGEMAQAIATAQSGIARAADNLSDLIITAPISGQVTGFSAHRGEVIAEGQRLGEVDGQDRLRIAADVDQFYLGQVTEGGAATLDLDDRSYRLRVSRIDPEVSDRTFRIELEFTGPAPPDLRAGQSVQPKLLIGDAHQSLVVSNGAFLNDGAGRSGSGTQVFVVAADGRQAERHSAEFGRNNPNTVEVLGGLAAGERIIVSGTENFQDIERINIRGAIAPQSDEETTP